MRTGRKPEMTSGRIRTARLFSRTTATCSSCLPRLSAKKCRAQTRIWGKLWKTHPAPESCSSASQSGASASSPAGLDTTSTVSAPALCRCGVEAASTSTP